MIENREYIYATVEPIDTSTSISFSIQIEERRGEGREDDREDKGEREG